VSDVGLYLRRMVGRDPGEEHRASTPLELLFDLCFVVAVAAASAQLHHGIADGQHVAVLQYAMVFFAIWWAWMNFTWFASAYDTDDVPYRLLTLLQIAGGLVLAAGVPSVFHHYDFTVVTVGYVVMRVAMVGQWLRAARQDPTSRGATLRYALGVSVVQLGWVLRLLLPGVAGLVGFLVLLVAELAVPAFAEAHGRETPWHPGHINDRYGCFTLIVLGECVAAATVGVQSAITDRGLSAGLLVTAGGGLVLLFAMWWLYFKHEATAGLKIKQSQNLLWGYSHYVVFASVAAVGAGLTLAADGETPATVVAFAIAVPTCCYLATSAYLHGLLLPGSVPVVTLAATIVLVLATAAVAGALGLPASVAVIAVLVAALLVVSVRAGRRAETARAS
jgi:low temperature requirement protein LtrA